jgi:hypothetical protein
MRKRDLAARHRMNAEIKLRERSYKEGKTNPVQQLIALGAIAALITYLARHPMAFSQVLAGLMTVLTGLYFFGYLELRHPLKNQNEYETHGQSKPISPAQTTVGDARQDPHTVANAWNTRSDDEASTLAKNPAQGKSIIARRDPALDSWFIKSYLRCWTPPATLPPGEQYAAQIRVVHNVDGSLTTGPVLVNPPADPAWRAYADSAVRAVTKCNPLQVPSRYLSHFGQWRKMSLHFSPASLE